VRSVFIISDLHLGGNYPGPEQARKRGFRLCTHADAISRFVEQRTKEARRIQTEIVLNGDTVDFLAEADTHTAAGGATTWSSFTADSEAAATKFKTIVGRDKAVFDSFGPFLDAGGRLTILLGNHDIELSLPGVRHELRKALGVKHNHDFEFIYDNEAYVIGDALIEHGNRYDAWNQVDYDALRRIRFFQSRHLPVPPQYSFIPPAGSDMVTLIINTIKSEYAFVDLLKPETAAVVPMLLALEPGFRQRIGRIARLYNRTRSELLNATSPKFGGDVRAERDLDVVPGADTENIAAWSLEGASTGPVTDQESESAALKRALQVALGSEAEAFLHDIDAQIAEIDPLAEFGQEVGAFDTASRVFGIAALLFGRTSQAYHKRLPALLRAMQGLQNTAMFERETETAKEYLNAAQDLADRGGFSYVVFGHTHLAKHVPLGNGRFYLNSGTWADVLRFPCEILATQSTALAALHEFVAKIRAGDFQDWTLFCPTYVRLDLGDDSKVTNAMLFEAETS
jgi:UDP-2,3-diacylglucosamine pyrophosphatase LpxH